MLHTYYTLNPITPGQRVLLVVPFHREKTESRGNNLPTATELIGKQDWNVLSCQVPELCPSGLGTPHSHACTHRGFHQHTHTQRHPHRGMHDHVQTCYLLPCSPTHPQRLPQEQGVCGQGVGKQSGALYPQATPLQSHQVSRSDQSFKAHTSLPPPRSLPTARPTAPLLAFITK